MKTVKKATQPTLRLLPIVRLEEIWAGVTLVALTLGVTMLKGLYWSETRSIFVLVVTVILSLYLVPKFIRRSTQGLRVADLLVTALVLCYTVALPFAASKNGAVKGVLLWVGLALTYWFWSRVGHDVQVWLAHVLVLCTTVSALTGLLAYAQVVNSENIVLGGRLAVSFEYPNTTAGLFNIGLFTALLLRDRRRWVRMGHGFAVGVLFTGLVLTLSRGGWLAFAVTSIVSLWVCRKELGSLTIRYVCAIGAGAAGAGALMHWKDGKGLALALLVIALGAILSDLLSAIKGRILVVGALSILVLSGAAYAVVSEDRYVLANPGLANHSKVIRFQVAGLAEGDYVLTGQVTAKNEGTAPAAGQISIWALNEGVYTRLALRDVKETLELEMPFVVSSKVELIEVRLSNWHPLTEVAIASPAIRGSEVLRLSNVLYRLLPYSVATRMAEQMTPQALASDLRIVMFRDGLKAWMRSPIIGYGGGGWRAVYSSVQSFYYGAGSAHSDIIDLLVEIGALGYLLYASLLLVVLGPSLWGKVDSLATTLTVSAISLLVHGIGEAIVAFPALYFWLFALLGVVSSRVPVKEVGLSLVTRWLLKCAVITTLVMATAMGSLVVCSDRIVTRLRNVDGKGLSSTVDLYRKAIRLNPLHAERKHELALHLAKVPNAQVEQRELIESAYRLERFDPRYGSLAGLFHFRHGDYGKALAYYSDTIKRQPWNPDNYTFLAYVAVEAALNIYPISPSEGEGFARTAYESLQRFEAQSLSNPMAAHHGNNKFILRPDFQLELGAALTLLGQYDEAIRHLLQATKSKEPALVDRAKAWLSRAYLANGQKEKAKALVDELESRSNMSQYLSRIERAMAR